VASLAREHQRLRLVGVVMTGKLLAIPLSWLVSVATGNAADWRMLYGKEKKNRARAVIRLLALYSPLTPAYPLQ